MFSKLLSLPLVFTLPILISAGMTSNCAQGDVAGYDESPDSGASIPERPRLDKADLVGSCEGNCMGQSDGSCWCDDVCEGYGDCCDDKQSECDCQEASCDGECGINDDNCGGTLDCGSCETPDTEAFLSGAVFSATGSGNAGPLTGLCIVDASVRRQGGIASVSLLSIKLINPQGTGRLYGYQSAESLMLEAIEATTIPLDSSDRGIGSDSGWQYEIVMTESGIDIQLDTQQNSSSAVMSCDTHFDWPARSQPVESWEGISLSGMTVTTRRFFVTPVLPPGHYEFRLGLGSSSNAPEMRVRAGYEYPGLPYYGWAQPDCHVTGQNGAQLCSIDIASPQVITVAINPWATSWASFDLSVAGF